MAGWGGDSPPTGQHPFLKPLPPSGAQWAKGRMTFASGSCSFLNVDL